MGIKVIFCSVCIVCSTQSTKPIGEIPALRMQGAVALGSKNSYHCFVINMRYDTAVVLGCKKQSVSRIADVVI